MATVWKVLGEPAGRAELSGCHLKDIRSSKAHFVEPSWGECYEQKNKTNKQAKAKHRKQMNLGNHKTNRPHSEDPLKRRLIAVPLDPLCLLVKYDVMPKIGPMKPANYRSRTWL